MSNDALDKTGLLTGIATFVFWGVAPIFFKFLQSAPAPVIIAHRVIWGFLFLLVFLLLRDRGQFLRTHRVALKQAALLLLSGSLVVGNWLIFVWAVTHDRIMDTSLGYFINPLVNVLLGLLFFGDRLRPYQWLALALAASATVYLGVQIGQAPWIALTLAFSFGFYGLLRKKLEVRPMTGLLWETLLLLPVALVYLLLYAPLFEFKYSQQALWSLLVLSGLVTILPLIGFNVAAKRLTLSIMGFLQYIAPSISFVLAVLLYDEPFDEVRRVAFAGIWLALLILTLTPVWRKSLSRRSR